MPKNLADYLLVFPLFARNLSFFFAAVCVTLALVWLNLLAYGLPLLFKSLNAARGPAYHFTFYISALLSTVLYLPILGTAAVAIKCDSNFDFTYLDDSVTCFSTSHAPAASLAIATLVSVAYVATVYKLFIFTFEPSAHNAAGKLSSTFDVLFQAIRTVETLVVILIPADVLLRQI